MSVVQAHCPTPVWKTLSITSEMIHHRGASLSEQQTADLLFCHGTQ